MRVKRMPPKMCGRAEVFWDRSTEPYQRREIENTRGRYLGNTCNYKFRFIISGRRFPAAIDMLIPKFIYQSKYNVFYFYRFGSFPVPILGWNQVNNRETP
jgi:hypothetical protein